jgi:hypothetical protein
VAPVVPIKPTIVPVAEVPKVEAAAPVVTDAGLKRLEEDAARYQAAVDERAKNPEAYDRQHIKNAMADEEAQDAVARAGERAKEQLPPQTPPEEPPAAPVAAKPEPTPKAPNGGAAAEAPKTPATTKVKTPLELNRAEVNAVTREDVKGWLPDHLYAMRKKYPRDRRLQTIIQGELDRRAATATPSTGNSATDARLRKQAARAQKNAQKAPEAPVAHVKGEVAGPAPEAPTAAPKPSGGPFQPDPNRGPREQGGAVVIAQSKPPVNPVEEAKAKIEQKTAEGAAANNAKIAQIKNAGSVDEAKAAIKPEAPKTEAKPEKALLDKSQNEPAAPVAPVSKITNEVKPEAPKYTDADIAAEVKGWDETELRRVIAKEKVSDPIRKAAINELNERLKAKTATPANPNKGFEGPDREPSTPAEPTKAAEEAKPASAHDALPEGYVVGNSYAYSKDGAEVAKRELERHGYTDVIIRARKHGDNYEVIGKPPKAKVGKLEKSTPVDLSGAKSAGDVKRRVVQSLKNELNGVEHTTNIEEENGSIKIDGETVARVSKGRRGNPHDLNFVEHIKAAAGKGELPTIGGDGTYGEAVEEAVRAVRGWSLKRNGAPMVEVTLPNGFSLKIPKDKTLLQAAIKRIESGDETAWSGIVDKSAKAEDPNGPIKWPWGAPGSKSRLTAEEATSGGYANKSEITNQLEALAHANRQGTDAKAVTIKLPNGFEMTVEPHQAAATLDRIEKTPVNMWEDAEARPTSVQIDTKYGTNFNAKNDSPAPGYKVPLKGLDKPVNPEPEPPTVPTGGGAKPTPKKGLRVGAADRPTSGPTEGVAADKPKSPKAKAPTTKDGSTKADLLARHGLAPDLHTTDVALERQKAADEYFELQEKYKQDKSQETYTAMRAAGKKFGELNAATTLSAAEEGIKAPELPPAPPKVKPAGKGPTNEDISRMSPEEQDSALRKIVGDLKKKGKKLGKNEKGEINPEILAKLGMSAFGAAAGAATTPDDPWTGAILGGAVGWHGPTVFRVVADRVRSLPAGAGKTQGAKALKQYVTDIATGIGRTIPDFYRASYLSNIPSLAANAFAGPWGAGIMGSLEHALSGDERGMRALKELLSVKLENGMPVPTFMKEWSGPGLKEAETLMYRAGERGDVVSSHNKIITAPARAMTAGDIAARRILMRAGFSENEARQITLTSEPLSSFAAALGGFRRAKNAVGKASWLAKMALPFYRTNVNQIEQSLLRTPFGNAIRRNFFGVPEVSMAKLWVQSGMTGAVAISSYQLGANINPSYAPYVLKLLTNFAGPYGTTAGVGFLAGYASQKKESLPDSLRYGIQTYIKTGTPLPTLDYANELVTFGANLFHGRITPPYGTIPGPLSSRQVLSVPTLERMVQGDPDFTRPTKDEYSVLVPFADRPKLAPKPKTPYQLRMEKERAHEAELRKQTREREGR